MWLLWRYISWCWMVFVPLGLISGLVHGQLAEHFAVGPLPENVELPLQKFDGFHLGIGKCLKEVPTSSLFPNSKNIPPGNGSNPYLSVVERCCEGYKRYKYDRQYCVPKCTTKCRNGFCVAPNVCVCYTDHIRSLDDECVTTCPIGCLNGKCDINGTCTCNPGFKLEPNKKFCTPVCSNGCGVNANCTAPEYCSCLPGFRLNASMICEAICVPNCGHGVCVGPNMCLCEPGFTLKDRSCQANCTRGCISGRCVENDRCECDTGYSLINMGTKCDPICSKGCLYGNCTGPEHCTCFPGYEVKDGVCKPACRKGCKKGECVQPDTCTCKSGYTINSHGNECKPVCESGCSNGRCIAPNKCDCHLGYHNINGFCMKWGSHTSTSSPFHYLTTHIPPPIYNPAINAQPATRIPPTYAPIYNPAINAQPSTRVPPTYIPQHTTRHQPIFNPPVIVQPSQHSPGPSANYTAPSCNRSCLNGQCAGHNVCQCSPGYELELGSWHKCVPYCQGGCPNGQCTSPNFCTCNFGFIKKNGFCVYRYAK